MKVAEGTVMVLEAPVPPRVAVALPVKVAKPVEATVVGANISVLAMGP